MNGVLWYLNKPLKRGWKNSVILTVKSHKWGHEIKLHRCKNLTEHYCQTQSLIFLQNNKVVQVTTSPFRSLKNSPDLSWCHCRSWPCCQLATPDHRARTSRVKVQSATALVLLHRCRAAGAYRSPTRLPGPAAGCASSSAVLLITKDL